MLFASNGHIATIVMTQKAFNTSSSFFLHSNGPFCCPVDNEPFERNEVHNDTIVKVILQLHYLKILNIAQYIHLEIFGQ